MRKAILLLPFVLLSYLGNTQYILSNEELNLGFNYLIEDFKDPNSVKLNNVEKSTKKFEKECFTWAKYDVSGRNGFGGYTRNQYIVFFYDGEPIYVESKDGTYYMFANNDKVAENVIDNARVRGVNFSECNFEIEKRRKEAQEIQKKNSEIKTKQISDDQNRYPIIDKLFSENKIEAAKNEMDKLYFPEIYNNKNTIETSYLSFIKEKKENELKEDQNTLSNIRSSINSNEIQKVVQLWGELHSKNESISLKDSISQFIAKKEVGNTPINLSKSDISKFIELNKAIIVKSYKSLLKDTNIIIKFNQFGQCSIQENYKWNCSVFKIYSDDFITYQMIDIPLSIKLIDNLNKNVNQVLYAGTKKALALNRNGKRFYKVNFLTSNLIGEDDIWQQKYDDKLSKNEIRIEESYTRDFLVNDLKLDSRNILKSYNEKLSPKIFKKVVRSVSIFIILGVATIYTLSA